MITVHNLQQILKIENNIIHEQVNGLSQADSLLQPQPGGNCVNWVLGHLLTSQLEIIRALDGLPPFTPSVIARYDRDSLPVREDGEGVLPLSTLLNMHDQVQEVLDKLLDTIKEEDFEKEILVGERNVNLGWRVFFLHFHYTYHIGQLEYLRQLAGKLDKII